jgi:hypothetical protein
VANAEKSHEEVHVRYPSSVGRRPFVVLAPFARRQGPYRADGSVSRTRLMPEIGHTLSSEEHHPNDLLEYVTRVEAVDFLSNSGRYHPWNSNQGEALFDLYREDVLASFS